MTTPQTQSSPPLPLTMPVLTGRDICRDEIHNAAGQKCLIAWAHEGTTPRQAHAIGWYLEVECGQNDLVQFALSHTEDECADLWNRTMRKRGYVLSPDKSHFILPTPTTGEEKQR